MLNDQAFNQNLKNTMKNLEEGSVLLNEDLKALQSNFFFKGYFKKQDDAKAK